MFTDTGSGNNGGGGEIRTLEVFQLGGFQDRCNNPSLPAFINLDNYYSSYLIFNQLLFKIGAPPRTQTGNLLFTGELQYHYANEAWWLLLESNKRVSPYDGDFLPTEISNHLIGRFVRFRT